MDKAQYVSLEGLSPFEIKDELIKLAREEAERSSMMYLNAGRGNPNWIATSPREAYFLLGQFAVTESKRVHDEAFGIGGMPEAPGVAERFDTWLEEYGDMPGADTLKACVHHAIAAFGFEPDAFVYELVDGIIGDNYPVPDRALVHTEQIVHEYLMWAMCDGHRPEGRFDLYPVEGGTAAMCYLFKTLKANRLLNPGDTIALGTPIFTPYMEMTELEDYGLNAIHVPALQEHGFQFTEEAFAQLENPEVKAFFLVNPGNPSSIALNGETIARLVRLVREKRPDLMILTDDVYGTFVPDFESVMGHLPHNTIGVYSYSKYFGCTGWRLGVIAMHEDNVFDRAVAALPEETRAALDRRYATLSLTPRAIKFIDRIVADSRDVALNHTAGLSLPQQIMMCLFSLVELVDTEKNYQKACMAILKRRFDLLVNGMGIEVNPGTRYDAYYGIIDFEFWLRRYVGEEVVDWVKANIHPLDISFKLAEHHGIVLLNCSGFDAPNWSARVSFANLDDDAYESIGRSVRAIARGYVQAYQASKGAVTA